MVPVRKPHNRFGRHIIGAYSSVKMNNSVCFESTIERDLFYLLDYDAQVTYFEEQPLIIEYSVNAKHHQYVPDVLIKYSDGREVVGECKPMVFLQKDRTRLQIAAGEMYCRMNGKNYRVFTDEDIRAGYRLSNIKLMYQFARHNIPYDAFDKIERLKRNNPDGMLIHELYEHLCPENPERALFIVLNLLYHHHLHANLDNNVLNPGVRVCFSGQPMVQNG